jgi:hypothetical protein
MVNERMALGCAYGGREEKEREWERDLQKSARV